MPCALAISKLNSAKNIWQARCSVVAFANLTKEKKITSLLLKSCSLLIKREERFAKTGVGWILRELSRHDKAAVREFVENHRESFSPESIKNALKYFADIERKK